MKSGEFDDDNPYDDLIHDDDMEINGRSNHIVNFTYIGHNGQYGVSEVIDCDGAKFIVVFWSKDSSDVNNTDLTSQLNNFNNANKVEAVSL